MKEAKLDWRLLNLQFHNNCKNNIFNNKQASGKLPHLFTEAEEHTLMEHRVSFKGYTNITNKEVWLPYFCAKYIT